MVKTNNLRYDVDEKPQKKWEQIILSLQHVFAMFGSTILVPLTIGLDVSTSLFTAGIGTLIYTTVTKKKVPVFIGSSFTFIAIETLLLKKDGYNGIGNIVLSAGILYLLFALLIKYIGPNFIYKILPPIVIGPIIMVIGLSLAPGAVKNAGFSNMDSNSMIISAVTIISATLSMLIGKKLFKMIPIIIGIISGYITAIILGLLMHKTFIDFSKILEFGPLNLQSYLGIPKFHIPFVSIGQFTYNFEFRPDIFSSVIPLVFVTLAEHIGDHRVSSEITGKDFFKDPGLKRTVAGDGFAHIAAGLLGGPVNTTYAENTGVIIMTKVASVYIIRLAAIFAMLLAFLKPIIGFINSIPSPVMGGISIMLFGMIAQNGIKILLNAKSDITHTRNMVIIASTLIFGIGGAMINFNLGILNFNFSQMSLAALIGILLNLILPQKEVTQE